MPFSLKRHRLKQLSLEELSVVDKPANQHALQVMRKRQEQRVSRVGRLLKSLGFGPDDETQADDVVAMSDTLSASVADILEKCETPEELEAALTETLEQFRDTVLKAAAACDDGEELAEGETGGETPPAKKPKKPMGKTDDEYAGDGEVAVAMRREKRRKPDAGAVAGDNDKITKEHGMETGERATLLKGLSPEAVAYIEKMEGATKAATDAAKAATTLAQTAIEKLADQDVASTVKALIGGANIDLADAVAIYKGAVAQKAAGDEKAVERVEKMFKKQAELIAKSALFEESGASGESEGGEQTAYAELQKAATEIAAEIRKSGTRISPQQAFAKACEQHPELYEQYLDENPAQISASA